MRPTVRDPEGIRHVRIMWSFRTVCGKRSDREGWVGAPMEWSEDCGLCFAAGEQGALL